VSITLALLFTLAGQCAPDVHPETIAAIVRTKSNGNALKIHINGASLPSPAPTTKDEVISLARKHMTEGRSVDLGLMQINSKNFKWLGLSIEGALDPCKNLAAGARILKENYSRATQNHEDGQDALRAALSAYQTGDEEAGLENGFVARVLENSNYDVPTLKKAAPASWDAFSDPAAASSSGWDVFSEPSDAR